MKQHIQTGTILLLIAAALILGFLTIRQLSPLILLILIAIVITTGIDPLVTRVQRAFARWWQMPRPLATLLVVLFGVLIILGLFSSFIFTAVSEAVSFAQHTWPRFQPAITDLVEDLTRKYDFIPDPATIAERVGQQSGRIVSYLWSTTLAVFGFIGGIFSLITVLIFTFFFTTYKDGITRTLLQLVPPQYHLRVKEISHDAAQRMGGWLRGQLLLALIITVVTAVGMFVFQIPYAILIGVIGGIGELIPMVGPYVAFFPALGIALATGAPTWAIVAIIIFFAVLSQVENYILAPKIMERQVGLHPVSTILALFIGGSLLGIVGALLAVPLAAAGRVIMLRAVFPAIQGLPVRENSDSPPPESRRRRRRNR